MKFTKEMIQAILDGKKTETRRLVKEGEIIATKPIIKPGKVKGKMIGYGDEGPIYEVREGGKIPEIIPASYKNSEPFVWTENGKSNGRLERIMLFS